MDNSVILRSQLVEAKVVGSLAVGNRYQFLQIPNLSQLNIAIYAIEAFGYSQLRKSNNNNPVIGAGATSDTPTTQTLVTLLDADKREFVYNIPYYTLIRENNNGFLTYIAPRRINLTDCYVSFVDTTNIAVGESAIFNIYYKEV